MATCLFLYIGNFEARMSGAFKQPPLPSHELSDHSQTGVDHIKIVFTKLEQEVQEKDKEIKEMRKQIHILKREIEFNKSSRNAHATTMDSVIISLENQLETKTKEVMKLNKTLEEKDASIKEIAANSVTGLEILTAAQAKIKALTTQLAEKDQIIRQTVVNANLLGQAQLKIKELNREVKRLTTQLNSVQKELTLTQRSEAHPPLKYALYDQELIKKNNYIAHLNKENDRLRRQVALATSSSTHQSTCLPSYI